MKRLALFYAYILSLTLIFLSLLAKADPLEGEQWALYNDGRPRSLEVDFMTPMWLGVPKDRPKQDLNLPSPKKSKKKIVVAVLDTGVDTEHPELKNKIVRRESECAAYAKYEACLDKDGMDKKKCDKIWYDVNHPEVDLDGNGYPMDCTGWSLMGGVNPAGILGRADVMDKRGHGTHVAGLVTAESGNGIGIRGCSENAKILPVQVLSKAPNEPIKPLSTDIDISPVEPKDRPKKFFGDLVARGMMYAIHAGVDIINLSLGWPQAVDSDFAREVFAEAHRRGIIIVAAAGNDSTTALLRPCSYPGVICVASHNPDGSISNFSNYGAGVDIAAPGLDVLSTWPVSGKKPLRPKRHKGAPGYEYLHGTSQASPLVSCMAAEMLAKGIPSDEVYPRLVLGGRAHEKPVKAWKVPRSKITANMSFELRPTPYEKFTLGGNADLRNSLSLKAQPLILPESKEKQAILWDRQTSTLKLPLKLKNYWKSTSSIKIKGKVVKAARKAIRPRVSKISGTSGAWKKGRARDVEVILKIDDVSIPERTRIPSEFNIEFAVDADGKRQKFQVSVEVIVPVTPKLGGKDVQRLAFAKPKPKRRGPTSIKTLRLHNILDSQKEYLDYLFYKNKRNDSKWTFYLSRQNRNADPKKAPYELANQGVELESSEMKGIPRINTSRIDLENDGRSEYIISILDDRSGLDEPEDSPVTLFYFDEDFNHLKTQIYESEKAQYIANTSIEIQWMTYQGTKIPTWIVAGHDPKRKITLRERRRNPDLHERYVPRLYFIKPDGKLDYVHKHEGYDVMYTLAPTQEQIEKGIVPALFMKNHGTELKPSYRNDYAFGEVQEGKVIHFEELPSFDEQGLPYRNLLEITTRMDAVFNLSNNEDLYRGSYWFADDARNFETRVSLLDNKDLNWIDAELKALREGVDGALWARYAYKGDRTASTFILTNSEIQFHDLQSGQTAIASLQRYTFHRDFLTSNLNFPFVAKDSQTGKLLPTIFTTEGSGFNRGMRFLIPHYENNELIELRTLAKLRFEAGRGCRSMDVPFWSGEAGTPYVDYLCKGELIRLPLVD